MWTIDHDDGSQFYNDTGNLMVFGGCKNYMGHSKSCDHNVIVHPGISERSAGGRRCQTDDNQVFANQYHHDNHCFVQDGDFYSMGIDGCNASSIDPHVYQTWNNTLYSPNSTFQIEQCGTFKAWQATGQDAGSKLTEMLPPDQIAALGKDQLPGAASASIEAVLALAAQVLS